MSTELRRINTRRVFVIKRTPAAGKATLQKLNVEMQENCAKKSFPAWTEASSKHTSKKNWHRSCSRCRKAQAGIYDALSRSRKNCENKCSSRSRLPIMASPNSLDRKTSYRWSKTFRKGLKQLIRLFNLFLEWVCGFNRSLLLRRFWRLTGGFLPLISGILSDLNNFTDIRIILTLAGRVTNKLSTLILLKMAERSEAKIAKRSFASKTKKFK